MSTERKPPIVIPATKAPSDPSKSAAFIFAHGLGDDAAGVASLYFVTACNDGMSNVMIADIAHQFQAANKLPYITWVLPNALEDRDVM